VRSISRTPYIASISSGEDDEDEDDRDVVEVVVEVEVEVEAKRESEEREEGEGVLPSSARHRSWAWKASRMVVSAWRTVGWMEGSPGRERVARKTRSRRGELPLARAAKATQERVNTVGTAAYE